MSGWGGRAPAWQGRSGTLGVGGGTGYVALDAGDTPGHILVLPVVCHVLDRREDRWGRGLDRWRRPDRWLAAPGVGRC